MAKKISITMDEELCQRLFYVSKKNGFKSTSLCARCLLTTAINKKWNIEHTEKIRTEKGCVYIIQETDSGYVKIGFATNFQKRLDGIKSSNPHTLKPIAVISGCIMQDELDLHIKYNEFCVRGEWYDKAVLQPLSDDIKRLEAGQNIAINTPISSVHYPKTAEA